MYLFYLNDVLLPITPEKLTTKIGNGNKTMDLVNSGEINLIKFPRLTEYSFEFELSHNINSVTYRASNKTPKEILDLLENAKKNKEILTFKVVRKMGNTTRFDTDQKVTVESYDVVEDSDNNSDMVVSLELKQFRPYRTKHLSNYDANLNSRPNLKGQSTQQAKEEKKKVSSVACLKQLEIKTHLNIRSGAGTHNRIVAKFKPKEKPTAYAEYLHEGKTWYKIKHPKGDNGYGWISGDTKYVRVIKDLKNNSTDVNATSKSILNDYNSGRTKAVSANPNR